MNTVHSGKIMNNACCNSTMSVVGVRAAALGSRGLFLCRRQCKFLMGTKGSPSPPLSALSAARSSLPHLHWPRSTRPQQRSSRQQQSLLLVQCSVEDPFPPATTYVLLNTKGNLSQRNAMQWENTLVDLIMKIWL